MAFSIFGIDPTPGFSLGISNKASQAKSAGNSFTGATPTQVMASKGGNPKSGGSSVNNISGTQGTRPAGGGGGAVLGLQDPYQQSAANTGYSGGGSGGGGGAAAPAEDPAYGYYGQEAQNAINRALSAYAQKRTGIGQQFNTQRNELMSGFNQNKADYDRQLTMNDQSRLSSANQAKQGVGQSFSSLQRILGGIGAGAGSEARYLLPQLAGQQLNQELSGVDTTAAQNKQSLATNWNNYQNGFRNEERKLNDWRTQELAQTDATQEQTTSMLNRILQAINSRADTAANLGGQLSSVASGIPNIVSTTPTYTGETPVYNPANLSTYQMGAAPTAEIQQNLPGAADLPYLSLLLGDQRERQPLI